MTINWDLISDQLELAILSQRSSNRLIQDSTNKTFREFNEIIGLPRKDQDGFKDVVHPIYDYETDLIKRIMKYQHLWMLKSRGLGITEIILRFLSWLCLSSDSYAGRYFHIITGVTEKKAAMLIQRMENILKFNYPDIKFESKYTELKLNQTIIQAFPTKALKDLRGDVNVSYIFIDEADFFDPAEQQELPYVIKSYEEKSNAKIIMVSTPNRPDGLFANIEKGLVFKDFFHMVRWNYEIGLGKIYSQKFIDAQKEDPEFEREYNLKYLGKIGNVFPPHIIEQALSLGDIHGTEINGYAQHIGGIDPEAEAAVYVGEFLPLEETIKIVKWRKFTRDVTPSELADYAHELYREIPNLWWFVDGANRMFVNEIKTRFGEYTGWDQKKSVPTGTNKVIPVYFGREHKEMLRKLYNFMTKGKLAIPRACKELEISLRTAWATDWDLDKNQTVNSDDLDALRLLLTPLKIE